MDAKRTPLMPDYETRNIVSLLDVASCVKQR